MHAREQQTPEVRNTIASAWMKRGIALLDENTTASLTDSLRWFERAIALRRSLPLHENAWYRYVLAAGWMNRGDALTRLGSTENLVEAVNSYDQALDLLRTLKLESNPLFRRRLGLAWMNRGITLQEQGTSVNWRAALESFDQAITVLRDPLAVEGPEDRVLLASALTNRSNALLCLTPGAPTPARDSVEEALDLIVGIEAKELVAAETGLKARYILCRSISYQLADRATKIAARDLVAAATDAVDDGMKLARHWEACGESRFRALASELFRFGARAYQMHQSHFLTEFLLENLDPSQSHDAFPLDPKMHSAASEAIAHAFAEIQRDSVGALNTRRFDQLLKTLRQLRETETRLEELRPAHS